MCKSLLPMILVIVGLTGCLSTHTKTGLARPDFSKPAPVTSATAVVQTKSCCGKCCETEKKPDLTTPPERDKSKKIIGELPEYQGEDDGSF